jgi:hypothetical protein
MCTGLKIEQVVVGKYVQVHESCRLHQGAVCVMCTGLNIEQVVVGKYVQGHGSCRLHHVHRFKD